MNPPKEDDRRNKEQGRPEADRQRKQHEQHSQVHGIAGKAEGSGPERDRDEKNR